MMIIFILKKNRFRDQKISWYIGFEIYAIAIYFYEQQIRKNAASG